MKFGERWTQTVAIGVPLLCFAAVRVVLDAGPAEAPAAQPPAPVVAVNTERRQPTTEQLRAAEWTRSRRPAPDLRSPMTRGVPVVPDVEPVVVLPTPDPPADPAPPPPADPALLFTVTSLMEAGSRQLATINGLTYSPGEEIAPGYRLERVHGSRRIAVISCPDGRTVELRQKP